MPAPSRCLIFAVSSPSLRGSGLKYSDICKPLPDKAVSLFTREWIEIHAEGNGTKVSGSPSLRGSGLKCFTCKPYVGGYRLPLYEGVD